MILRPFQSRSVSLVVSEWSAGARRALLIAPTGSGKTVIAGAVVRDEIACGGRVLVVVHRSEIQRQTVEKFAAFGVHCATLPGLIDPDARVIVAMVQTLAKRGPDALPWTPTLQVTDEAHHLQAPSHRRVAEWFPAARHLYLTATPWGIPPEMVDAQVVAATPTELRALGLSPPLKMLTFREPDTSNVRIRGGEFAADQLAQATNVRTLRGNVVQSYLPVSHLPAFCFAVNRAHSKALVADFVAAGIPAEHIDGESKDREAILDRFRSGQTRVLSNCDLFGEGVDVPGARVAILARSLWSLRAFLQQTGRVGRDNRFALIHDHGGNLERHGHPQMDRDYSVTADVRPQRKTLRECPVCATRSSNRHRYCPQCAWMFPAKEARTAVVELDAPTVVFEPDTCAEPYNGHDDVTDRVAA